MLLTLNTTATHRWNETLVGPKRNLILQGSEPRSGLETTSDISGVAVLEENEHFCVACFNCVTVFNLSTVYLNLC